MPRGMEKRRNSASNWTRKQHYQSINQSINQSIKRKSINQLINRLHGHWRIVYRLNQVEQKIPRSFYHTSLLISTKSFDILQFEISPIYCEIQKQCTQLVKRSRGVDPVQSTLLWSSKSSNQAMVVMYSCIRCNIHDYLPWHKIKDIFSDFK